MRRLLRGWRRCRWRSARAWRRRRRVRVLTDRERADAALGALVRPPARELGGAPSLESGPDMGRVRRGRRRDRGRSPGITPTSARIPHRPEPPTPRAPIHDTTPRAAARRCRRLGRAPRNDRIDQRPERRRRRIATRQHLRLATDLGAEPADRARRRQSTRAARPRAPDSGVCDRSRAPPARLGRAGPPRPPCADPSGAAATRRGVARAGSDQQPPPPAASSTPAERLERRARRPASASPSS